MSFLTSSIKTKQIHLTGMIEKRSRQRVLKKDNLVIEIISSGECQERKRIQYTITKNISLEGVNIRSNVFLAIDTTVEIKLNARKTRNTICVRAKVRWIRSIFDDEAFEIGLEFVDSTPQVITSLIGHLYGT